MHCIEDLLLQTALKSPMDLPYGCVIMHRNKVIATGFNSYETNKCCASQQCILRALQIQYTRRKRRDSESKKQSNSQGM